MTALDVVMFGLWVYPSNKSGCGIEVCLNSHWGRVCRDGWDNDDAKVVCNQLGFGRDGIIPITQLKLKLNMSHSGM